MSRRVVFIDKWDDLDDPVSWTYWGPVEMRPDATNMLSDAADVLLSSVKVDSFTVNFADGTWYTFKREDS